MLRWRVLTAAVGVPLLVLALFQFPSSTIAGLFGVVILIGAWEWTHLAGCSRWSARAGYLVLVLIAGVALYPWQQAVLLPVLLLAAAWWLWSLRDLVRYTGSGPPGRRGRPYKLLSGLAVLVPCWLALVVLHAQDQRTPLAVLLLLVLVWVADTFAYFTGRAWGHYRLAPRISPGKTVEGFVGGMVGVVVFGAVTGYWIWQLPADDLVAWLILCVVVAVFSVIGDLYESMLKREAGVKDSGHLLPGHGGILDRIDSVTAAAPLYTLGWWWLVSTAPPALG